ncbi:hypothetical protein BDP55DRAFT_62649 [Colletotrichum godetiae]|uniref:Uncharacterized protein n=1 Tax=Colletotrichum godetiae TaxID=1209918 RepID=A0AAJ0EW15_9PEZI|nr:uncharacterized protein BDP55DRAFT_62649 [Colletotrichum godetiae]KAK1688255.1 hypothetical protein BDP55DRAFT_62649 [Colletotrichum godetiae]
MGRQARQGSSGPNEAFSGGGDLIFSLATQLTLPSSRPAQVIIAHHHHHHHYTPPPFYQTPFIIDPPISLPPSLSRHPFASSHSGSLGLNPPSQRAPRFLFTNPTWRCTRVPRKTSTHTMTARRFHETPIADGPSPGFFFLFLHLILPESPEDAVLSIPPFITPPSPPLFPVLPVQGTSPSLHSHSFTHLPNSTQRSNNLLLPPEEPHIRLGDHPPPLRFRGKTKSSKKHIENSVPLIPAPCPSPRPPPPPPLILLHLSLPPPLKESELVTQSKPKLHHENGEGWGGKGRKGGRVPLASASNALFPRPRELEKGEGCSA